VVLDGPDGVEAEGIRELDLLDRLARRALASRWRGGFPRQVRRSRTGVEFRGLPIVVPAWSTLPRSLETWSQMSAAGSRLFRDAERGVDLAIEPVPRCGVDCAVVVASAPIHAHSRPSRH
jgi:hypothetical protein